MPRKRLMTTAELAAVLGKSIVTIKRWRWRKRGGPPWIVADGQFKGYDKAVVDRWIRRNSIRCLPKKRSKRAKR